MRGRFSRASLLLALLVMLSGCASRAPVTILHDGPGFWLGLWHGLIAPIAFIGHLFSPGIAVYASPNNGGWYDLGFLLGIGAISATAASSAKK